MATAEARNASRGFMPTVMKSHISGYTRKDGVFVADHDDKRTAKAAAPRPGGVGGDAPARGRPKKAVTASFAGSAKAAEDEGDIPDAENPKFALSRLDSQHVAAAARSDHDLNLHAKRQLASRGLDSSGEWVGFAQAQAHHGVKPQGGDPDAIQAHMQTLHPKVLAAAASGKVDLNARARAEAAGRGIDHNGKWIGFEKAKELHAQKPKAATLSKAIPLLFFVR